MQIKPSIVSDIISKLDLHKSCELVSILAIILMKYAPEISPIPSKIYINFLTASCFSCFSAYWDSPSKIQSSGNIAVLHTEKFKQSESVD